MEITEREAAFRSGLLAYIPIQCVHCGAPCRTLWRTDMVDVEPIDACSDCTNYFESLRLVSLDVTYYDVGSHNN